MGSASKPRGKCEVAPSRVAGPLPAQARFLHISVVGTSPGWMDREVSGAQVEELRGKWPRCARGVAFRGVVIEQRKSDGLVHLADPETRKVVFGVLPRTKQV